MSSEPHYHSHDDFKIRKEKLTTLSKLKVEPYPNQYVPTDKMGKLQTDYEGEEIGSSDEAGGAETPEVTVAGRMVLFRAMGKNAFGHVQDESGRLQVMFNRDKTIIDGYQPNEGDPTHIKFVEKLLDLGDIIGIEGHLFRTMKGELTVFAKKVTLLCKTLLPLPDKHSGLTDKETRYRKRWLDLISHSGVVQTFQDRSRIIRTIRRHLEDQEFMEVETPVLQNIYGGANAKPFLTHLESLGQEMFMRISLEPSLKKLIAGGLERVFEIGKTFRNEGIDRNHNPEFTMLEAYAAYWDYNDQMNLIETLCEKLALELYSDTKVAHGEGEDEVIIDFKRPWTRYTMKEALKVLAEIDIDPLSDDEMRGLLKQKSDLDPLAYNKAPRGMLIAMLFEELVEDKLIQPCHITDHPIETTPLCKPHRDPKQREEGIVERFESYILGHELCNAYTELNNPVLQRELLEAQQDRRDEGDEEASPLDEEFIEAICQGCPPFAGIGVGIDRLVMIFTNCHSIRDVLFFPLMRREDGHE